MARDPDGFRWRTRSQIDEGRSWLWVERRDDPLQGRGVGVDAGCGPDSAGLGRSAGARSKGYAQRGMRDLCRLLLERVPTVCLFVRPENAPAIRVYEAIGMQRHGYVSVADLLIRLLRLALAAWVLRWAAQQFASYVTRHRPRHPNG